MSLSSAANPTLLRISGLTVRFGDFTAVESLDLAVAPGETVALVGESGSGKSVTSLAVTRLLDHAGGRIVSGQITFQDREGRQRELTTEAPEAMRRLRGPEIAMIFQEPMTSLNPVLKVGEQITEAIRLHQGMDGAAALAEARRLLEKVRIPEAARQLERYPFQMSGGMRQRVMIAMALSCRPRLLIADEPTTALDVTVQAQVLRLIRSLQQETGLGMIFITHDMGVVAEIADRVVVMRRGRKVEEGEVNRIFAAPQHPYTKRLLAAVPVLGSLADQPLPVPFPMPDAPPPQPLDTVRPEAEPVLELRGLTTRFDVRRGWLGRVVGRIHAAEQVSFSIRPGETLAVVGESGCGKSTTGRSIIRLEQPQSGEIRFAGEDVTVLDRQKEARLRRGVQFIFQDPFASLDPRLTVGFSVAEPILTHNLLQGRAVQDRVAQLLTQVGLGPEHARRYPHELSGGQRQRVCIARALASEPRLIIADEAVAALDVSIRAQVVNLMMRLQQEMGLAYLFISHDMAVVERISHRVAVMYLGQVVEIGPRQAVMNDPQHPYTKRLLAAVPVPDPARRGHDRGLDDSEVPSPLRRPDDMPEVAPLVPVGPDHYVARHRIGGLY
ncbi:dipeptide ABC transporter ATP-binding protein [Pseudoroseomonas wenyumeiae]|uniref:Glutathione import ATP-binding protein GsiA n=1 Tax=Teichococcus wenyumeiae TaxID=2478470 RepID=A0A3A9JJT6_9PROT|nr:ABC transporter ATP-binding protein [Pseudoroseomonas wenyumeiae]RKK04835.1 ABC transporter ATP-binding protein [Pseudoroseomonas wenyumeiae]RMI20530.1 dipeptide ABC transporter ATP-binding protein [Pseudoroseomonas wenyumeiae]